MAQGILVAKGTPNEFLVVVAGRPFTVTLGEIGTYAAFQNAVADRGGDVTKVPTGDKAHWQAFATNAGQSGKLT